MKQPTTNIISLVNDVVFTIEIIGFIGSIGVGPVSPYRLLTVVVVVVVACIVTVAVGVVIAIVVVVVIGGGGSGGGGGGGGGGVASSGTIVIVALASFQHYCSRSCLRTLLIFGLPVYVILRNIRYEFSDVCDEIASLLSSGLSCFLHGFSNASRSLTLSMLTSLFSQS